MSDSPPSRPRSPTTQALHDQITITIIAAALDIHPSLNETSSLYGTSLEQRMPMLKKVNDMMGRESLDRKRIVLEMFDALYLPDFIQAYIHGSYDLLSQTFAWFTTWGLRFTLLPAACRYFRERPEMGAQLWIVMLERFSILPDAAYENEARTSINIVQILARFCWSTVNNLIIHYPKNLPFPVPPAATMARLPARVSLIENYRLRVVPSLNPREDREILGLLTLTEGNGRVLQDDGSSIFGEMAATSWLRCEWQIGDDDRDPDLCGDELSMPACGRCRAVRYCSREHQKQDWQRHKQFCFPPVW